MDVGFETTGSTLFLASIDTCDTANSFDEKPSSRQEYFQQLALKNIQAQIEILTVEDIPDTYLKEVRYYVQGPGNIKLYLQGPSGENNFLLIDHEFRNPGVYRKQFPVNKLDENIYEVVMQTRNNTYRKVLRSSE